MNDDLQKALTIILQKTTAAATAGVDFLSEQLPDVVRQLLIWHAAQSAIRCAIYLALAALLCYAAKRLWRHAYTLQEDSDERAWTCIGAFVAAIIALIWLFVAANNLEWLQIWLAPKLYLVEYTAAILKGAK